MSDVKHILGAGCSFTQNGWGLQSNNERERDSDVFERDPDDYPHMIAENLGITADNIAQSGSGWQFHMYLVQKWVESNKDKVEDTLLVMGLTSINRGTFFTNAKYPRDLEKNGIYADIPNHLTPNVQIPDGKLDNIYWKSRGYDGKDVRDFFMLYYNIAFEPEHWETWQYMQLRMFQSWLRDVGLRFIFIKALDKKKRPEEVENLYTFPDGSQVWTDYITGYDKSYEMDLHPNIYDHHELAELLTEHIQETYSE